MDFLELEGRTILVVGVANRRSVAWNVGRLLAEAGAKVVYSVRSPERREQLAKLAPGSEIFVCDLERPEELERLGADVAAQHQRLDGILHSVAFADYEGGVKPFHETGREVLTLSRDQVNKPIYTSAIGRHRNYERHLGPLKDVLDRGLRGRDVG